jgi:hypothetical protein
MCWRSQDQVEEAEPAAAGAVAAAGDRCRLLQFGGRRRRLQRGGGSLLLGALTVPAGGGSRGRFGRRPPFALSHRALFQLKRNRREREIEKSETKEKSAPRISLSKLYSYLIQIYLHISTSSQKVRCIIVKILPASSVLFFHKIGLAKLIFCFYIIKW